MERFVGLLTGGQGRCAGTRTSVAKLDALARSETPPREVSVTRARIERQLADRRPYGGQTRRAK